ncbi:MaoC family dehydratase [Parvibaculum sp.]|uniref:MaoC family dehydratase n=1 Tax=Parvibaculum sp. TaxID=2024848 RepID=UPI003210662E
MPWFEDIELNVKTELGSHTFTEEEIIRFARKYDPTPFHVDPEAGKDSPFGGLIASRWHTAATWMKLMVPHVLGRQEQPDEMGRTPAAGPSPGILDVQWPAPVRPGDTISYSTTPVEKVEMRSRPDWGILKSRNEGVNQRGEIVLRFIGQALIQRKPKTGEEK